jgi:hypothetical protein
LDKSEKYLFCGVMLKRKRKFPKKQYNKLVKREEDNEFHDLFKRTHFYGENRCLVEGQNEFEVLDKPIRTQKLVTAGNSLKTLSDDSCPKPFPEYSAPDEDTFGIHLSQGPKPIHSKAMEPKILDDALEELDDICPAIISEGKTSRAYSGDLLMNIRQHRKQDPLSGNPGLVLGKSEPDTGPGGIMFQKVDSKRAIGENSSDLPLKFPSPDTNLRVPTAFFSQVYLQNKTFSSQTLKNHWG